MALRRALYYSSMWMDGKQSDIIMDNVAMKKQAEYIMVVASTPMEVISVGPGVDNELMLFTVSMPGDPVTHANATAKGVWEPRIEEYVNRDNKLVA
jgi:hypothetical protein